MTGLHRSVAPSERISLGMSLGTTVRCIVHAFPLPESLKEVMNEDFYLSLIEALSHWIVLQSGEELRVGNGAIRTDIPTSSPN